MGDEAKTKAQLIRALAELRQRITTLETREAEHERVEEEIWQLKEFSESLIQNMAEGIAVEDAEGYFTFVNPAAATLLGYTPEELLGQHWMTIIPPDQQSIVRAADERRVRGETDRYELKLVDRDGTPLFVQVSGIPQFDATGRFSGTLAIFTDITERKRAEEALRASDMRFRSIVQSAIDAVILIDSHGRIISWNKGAQLIFGYTEEEVMNKPLTLLMPERYREAHQSGLARVNVTGLSHIVGKTLELAGLRKDDQEFTLELSLATWQTKEEAFYSGIVRDISERKRVEEALRESEERYHSLVEASPDVIVLTDLGATITMVNQQAVKLLGYEVAAEIIGKSAFDFIAPEDWPRATENMQRTLETGSVRDIEYTLLKKDGTRFPTELSASLIRDLEGKPKAFITVARDITARKGAEEALRQRNRELALLNRTSQAFNSSLDLGEVLVTIL